jgi:hypothetical protein
VIGTMEQMVKNKNNIETFQRKVKNKNIPEP